MQTRLLDGHDVAACRRAYDVLVAAKSLDRPWNEPPSFEESLLEFRHVDAAERMEMWEAVDRTAGLVTGIATLWLPRGDNTTQMWCEVAVDPAHTRRGAGAVLVDRLVERAGAEGRTTLVTDFMVPLDSGADHPYRRFATRSGFTLGNTETCRHLRLHVGDDLLDGLMEKARSASASVSRRSGAWVRGLSAAEEVVDHNPQSRQDADDHDTHDEDGERHQKKSNHCRLARKVRPPYPPSVRMSDTPWFS